jgi:hypothetical protein
MLLLENVSDRIDLFTVTIVAKVVLILWMRILSANNKINGKK